MGATIGGETGFLTLYQDKSGRTYVRGLWETRRKLMEMGMERNLFEKFIKEMAILGAKEASRTSPVISGENAMMIRGMASKKYTVNNVSKRAYGGVILGRKPYSRALSYGMYHQAGFEARENNSKRGYATRVWKETVRGRGNPFMVRAREKMKPVAVRLMNLRLKTWIKQKGFETNGF